MAIVHVLVITIEEWIKTGRLTALIFHAQTEHVFASLPQMERGVAKILGGDPKGNNFLYTNGKSVIIRNIDVIMPTFNIISDEKSMSLNKFKNRLSNSCHNTGAQK